MRVEGKSEFQLRRKNNPSVGYADCSLCTKESNVGLGLRTSRRFRTCFDGSAKVQTAALWLVQEAEPYGVGCIMVMFTAISLVPLPWG